jgi:hypothetical protein
VHREHDADGEAGRGNQRRRLPADLVDVPRDLAEFERGTEGFAQRAKTEERHVSHPGQRRDNGSADTFSHRPNR